MMIQGRVAGKQRLRLGKIINCGHQEAPKGHAARHLFQEISPADPSGEGSSEREVQNVNPTLQPSPRPSSASPHHGSYHSA
ncbi:hypothetical protein U0070_017514 [Myodes glareolus]|uniref:Uncharacterized protein n=1 Tax=Myodes glareolus TaxID=447135 RepID=A0AAW0HWM0_MYOGA